MSSASTPSCPRQRGRFRPAVHAPPRRHGARRGRAGPQGLRRQLKHARVWGPGVHDGTVVKGDYVVHERTSWRCMPTLNLNAEPLNPEPCGMTNAEIADAFDQVADLLEFQGANPFRVRAYRNAAHTIRGLPESLERVAERSRTASSPRSTASARTWPTASTRWSRRPSCRCSRSCRPRFRTARLQLLRIPGSGPKKAAAALQRAEDHHARPASRGLRTGEVRKLKGFGAKTEETILAGLPFASRPRRAAVLGRGRRIRPSTCASISLSARASSSLRSPAATAAARRRSAISTSSSSPTNAQRGDGPPGGSFRRSSKCSPAATPRCRSGWQRLAGRSARRAGGVVRRGAAILHRLEGAQRHPARPGQGPRAEDQRVRRVSRDGDEEATGPNAGVYIAGRTEEEVYAALELPLFPPELREARREFEWAAQGKLPELIELADIRGDLHMHTDRHRRQAHARRNGRRRAGARPEIHRHHRPLQARQHGQRPRRRPPAAAVGRDRRAQRNAERLPRPQRDRGRHPGERRARPCRRRARRGRLGDGQRPLRPEPAARADHAADPRCDWRTRTCQRSPIPPAG